VRSVLVCVRTSLAAQAVTSCAARLGLTETVRTAMSESEVMARLAERPVDVVLVDAAFTKPDSAGFTRRVLARSPGAVIVLFGAEHLRVAAAAGAARRVALTERELQVLHGMADGKSNAEIGRDLFVSEDTVKTHARRLYRKLGARDRAHAVAAGFRAGLVA
jgi:DNA-binding NarL/FixJ family response regulator